MALKMHIANRRKDARNMTKKLFSYRYFSGRRFNDLSAHSTSAHPVFNGGIRSHQINSLKHKDCLNWINSRKQQGAWLRLLKRQSAKLLLLNAKIRECMQKEPKERDSPVLENLLEEILPMTPMKIAAQKIRAFVFDILYGSGAHLKSLIFLTSYKIPKRFPLTTYTSGDVNTVIDKDPPASSQNVDSNLSSGESSYSVVTINFESHCKERQTNNDKEEKSDQDRVSNQPCPKYNDPDMEDLDILIITAEEDDFLFPEE